MADSTKRCSCVSFFNGALKTHKIPLFPEQSHSLDSILLSLLPVANQDFIAHAI